MEFGNSHIKFATAMWSFHGVSLPDSGVFFLTLTPLNGLLLEFCWCVKNIEIRIYREICNSKEQQTLACKGFDMISQFDCSS